jgi:hypothetical protein
MGEEYRSSLKRRSQIWCFLIMLVPHYLINSHFDFAMEWQLKCLSIFIWILTGAMSAGLVEILFHAKEIRKDINVLKYEL